MLEMHKKINENLKKRVKIKKQPREQCNSYVNWIRYKRECLWSYTQTKKSVIRLGNYEKVQMAHIKTVSYFILKTFCDANESDATENEHVHRIHSAFFGVRVRWMPFFISSDFFSHSSWSLCAAFLSIFIWLACFRFERRLCGHIWSGCCTDYSLSFGSFFCWFCLSASVDLFFFSAWKKWGGENQI